MKTRNRSALALVLLGASLLAWAPLAQAQIDDPVSGVGDATSGSTAPLPDADTGTSSEAGPSDGPGAVSLPETGLDDTAEEALPETGSLASDDPLPAAEEPDPEAEGEPEPEAQAEADADASSEPNVASESDSNLSPEFHQQTAGDADSRDGTLSVTGANDEPSTSAAAAADDGPAAPAKSEFADGVSRLTSFTPGAPGFIGPAFEDADSPGSKAPQADVRSPTVTIATAIAGLAAATGSFYLRRRMQ